MIERVKRILLLGPALVAVLFASATPAQAATITVNTTANTSVAGCALREAIMAANTNAAVNGCSAGSGGDVIDLASQSGTITLATTLPTLNSPMSIQGPGAGTLNVSGNDTVRVFDVGTFAGTAALSGLEISHGRCTFGCGIHSDGTVTLDGVTIDHNVSTAVGGANTFPEGAGIGNAGTMTVTLSTVSANSTVGTGGTSQNAPQGGGIYNGGTGTLTLDRSTVSGNDSTAVAGAGGTTNATGGGISNLGNLTLRRSTLSGNTASASASTSANTATGGGISNANAATVNVVIDRSTISGNAATATGTGANASAGGFNVFGTSFAVISATVTGNGAAFGANAVLGAPSTVKNTTISNPLGGGANCGGVATSQGFNLSDTAGCGFTQPTDLPSTNPLFVAGGLANNGGPTKTFALQPGSPAVDQGLSSAGEVADQRGMLRPYDFATTSNAAGGDGTDIGAYEVEDTTPPETSITSGPAEEAIVTDRSPGFGFTSDETATFECRFDAEAFAPCAGSAVPGVALGDGSHSFDVRATDLAGNVDASPATRGFSVDATAPETALTSSPRKKIKTKAKRKRVSIAFSSEAGSTFECKLDGAAFSPCTSPKTYSLKKGKHVIEVRASDSLGNTEATPARAAVTIKRKKKRR